MTYLVGGSVAVSKNGSVTANGSASRLFSRFRRTLETNLSTFIKSGRAPTNSVAYRFLESAANAANDIAIWLDGELNLFTGSAGTVGNVTVNAAIYNSQAGDFITMQAIADGTQSGGNNRQSISKIATIKNLGAGAVLVGGVTTLYQHKDTAATNLNLSLVGNDVIWTVTGAVGQTINWNIRVNRI